MEGLVNNKNDRVFSSPEYKGCYQLGKKPYTHSICFKHKPKWIHRFFMKLLLGWEWKNIEN